MKLNTLLPDVPESEYHADRDHVSNSWLKNAGYSPAHLKAYLDEPADEPDSAQRKALLEGKLVHTALLEPEELDKRFETGPDVNKNTKIWKEARSLAAAAGKLLVDPRQMEAAMRVHQAVYKRPRIVKLLQGQSEVSGFWRDNKADYDALCKFRVDLLPTSGTIPDLKTTQVQGGATPEGFGKVIGTLEHYLQPAHYLPGLAACGYDVNWDAPWCWIVVEMNPPFESNIFVLEPELLIAAQRVRSERMEMIAECLETNNWPGYTDEVKSPILPAWTLKALNLGYYDDK